MYAVVKMDIQKCSNCKLCIFSCPEPNVFSYNKESKEVAVADANRCKGCGLCVSTCPKEALTVGE